MKTQRLSNQNVQPFKQRHPTPTEKLKMTQQEEQEKLHELASKLRQRQKQDKLEGERLMREMLGRNADWRDLKFYHHKKDGHDYVDIIDRVSGDVLKTLPAPDYNKLANHFKMHPGITLDIRG